MEFSVPTNDEFRAESEQFLSICAEHCTCKNGWHFLWSAYKAAGRRRSVYFQQPLLAKLLAPMRQSVRSILIAGSADAGILSVLDSIFGSCIDYTAIDICAAPLVEMQRYAASKGITLGWEQTSLQDFVPQQTFDLVFVHNTLIYLQPAEAMLVLSKFKHCMHDNSMLTCGMRYERHPVGLSAMEPGEFAAEIRQMLDQTYSDRPDLVSLVAPHVDAYAASSCLGKLYRYDSIEFGEMLRSAGYQTVDAYTDILTPKHTLSMHATYSNILSEVQLLTLNSAHQRESLER